MSNIVTCEYCHGTGIATCETCGGNGKVTCPECDGSGKSYFICPECDEGRVPDPRAMDDDETMTCPTCHGEYKKAAGDCERCKGTGKVDCNPCKGSGKVNCKVCNATGKVDVEKIVKSAIVTDWYDVAVHKKVNRRLLSNEDIAMLKESASQGDGGACYVLGMLAHNGCVSYTDEGDIYFEKGAQAGDADCLYAHAAVLSRKEQNPDIQNEVMDCLKSSADKGNLHALIAYVLCSLKCMCDEREECPAPDKERLSTYFECMANAQVKDGYGQNLIDRANALGRLLPRILAKDVKAMTELATVCSELHEKTGCARDKALAEALLEQAAKLGSKDANRQLAERKSKDNLAESLAMLDKASKEGDKEAGEQLQKIMKACLKEQSKIDELEACAKSGNVAAMKFLAAAYENGDGVKSSASKSADWLELAAEQGDGTSMLDVSLCYRNGNGRKKDVNKAFEWTYKGFLKGQRRRSLRLLAEFYRYGYFDEPDDIKANELYTRSAMAGYIPAIVAIAKSYLKGWGVKKNLGEAKRLFELAAARGSEKAKEEIDKMPMGIKTGESLISGISNTFAKDKDPLPVYVKQDYEKAKSGVLWTLEFAAKRRANPVKHEEVDIGLDVLLRKNRKTFVIIGIIGGILGLHFLYAKRNIWFVLYLIIAVLGALQIKVEAFRNLLSHASPVLANTPVFAAVAVLIVVGSVCFMKKDGEGLKMK